MKILIDGTGAIGIALGASMISENVDVSFIARKETAKKLENGIKRIGLFKHLSYSKDEYTVYTDYESLPNNNFDYIFICSKTIANDDISKKLDKNRRILKKDANIIIFQNGFGNNEPYLRYFKKEQVYSARVITGFKRPERNISEITVHTEPILIGSLQGCSLEPVKIITEKISASGIPSETTNKIGEYLWAKMLYNCALNPLGAILKVNYGKLIENEYSKNIMNKIIEEIFNVIKASAYKTLWETPEEYEEIFYNKLVPDTYNHESSTLQDIEKKHKTEIDYLTGKIIELGEKNNIDVSVNKTIYNLIKTIEANL